MIRAAAFDRGDLSKEARHRHCPPGHFATVDRVAVLQESRLKVPQRPESVSEDLGQDASSHGIKAAPINLPQNREEVGSGDKILEPRSLGRQIRTNLLQISRLHKVIHSLQTVVHLGSVQEVCRGLRMEGASSCLRQAVPDVFTNRIMDYDTPGDRRGEQVFCLEALKGGLPILGETMQRVERYQPTEQGGGLKEGTFFLRERPPNFVLQVTRHFAAGGGPGLGRK